MNPELEALIRAYDSAREASPVKAVERRAEFESRVDELLAQHPKLSREALLNAVRGAHLKWVRAQGRPPTIPPHA